MLRTSLAAACIVMGLSGCTSLMDKHVEWEYVEPANYPVLYATGYAPLSAQQGKGETSKMLQAMRASKLDAYRELTEQVYGQKLEGEQRLSDLVLTNDNLRASVQGLIRGAKVVKTYPVGEDSYATELELDMQKVYEIYLTTARPKRVKQVKYY